MRNVFVKVKLSAIDFLGIRIGGAGLGNILFPWARSVVFAHQHGLQKISPSWGSFKPGRLLRNDIDKRNYHNIFLQSGITGERKLRILAISKQISEDKITNKTIHEPSWPLVINFRGLGNQMTDILGYNKIVKDELLKIVRPVHLNLANKNEPIAIAVHVRLGDFISSDDESYVRQGAINYRVPIRWYVAIIEKIRKELKDDVHVSVYSDGLDLELEPLLKLDNVVRIKDGNAISDMISLSKAKLLIASNSTFSLWASYLGQVPTIWFPGTHQVNLFEGVEVFEGEIDYHSDIPESVLAALV